MRRKAPALVIAFAAFLAATAVAATADSVTSKQAEARSVLGPGGSPRLGEPRPDAEPDRRGRPRGSAGLPRPQSGHASAPRGPASPARAEARARRADTGGRAASGREGFDPEPARPAPSAAQ